MHACGRAAAAGCCAPLWQLGMIRLCSWNKIAFCCCCCDVLVLLRAVCAGGGHLVVRVVHQWARGRAGRDRLLVSVAGRSLAAPLIERLLELPMDISSGTVDGEIHVAAHDDATWEFPAITGKITCKGEWGGGAGRCCCRDVLVYDSVGGAQQPIVHVDSAASLCVCTLSQPRHVLSFGTVGECMLLVVDTILTALILLLPVRACLHTRE